jgi:hypothetical protein
MVMFGLGGERNSPTRRNFLMSFPLWLLLIVSPMTPSGAFAEATAASTFSLEVKNKLINLHSENSSSLEILRELEKKTGVNIDIFKGVIDKKITLDIVVVDTPQLAAGRFLK